MLGTYARALTFFRADWPRVLLALALLLLNTGLALLKPWPLALIVDRLSGNPDRLDASWVGSGAAFVGVMTAALVAVYGACALLGAVQQALVISTGLRGLARVRRVVFDWLLALSQRRLQGAQAGELIYRATWDTFAFQTLFTQGVFTFLGAFTGVVAMTVVMARLNGPLTLVALATVPVLLLVMRGFGPVMSRRAGLAQAADAGLSAAVQQLVANLPLIQSFTRETTEARRFDGQVTISYAARWRQHRAEVVYLAAVALVLAAGTAAIVFVGARQVLAGRLSVGELLVFIAYLTQLYEPLNQLSSLGTTVSNARAGAERVWALLDEPPTQRDGPREIAPAADKSVNGATVEFSEVSFGYSAGRKVLDAVSFSVAPGEVVALIGPSGAGKSTLLQLLPRFLDPDAGVVRLHGVDVREFRLEALRRQVAVVLQEPLLLPATVAENIGFGREGASRADIEAAAGAANADGFIRGLPEGYDTVVGDGAARLSVGEKQRLNLARAFLKDAPVLLLDEPTSALDADSEAAVLAGLRELMRGRTVVMVAHRLATLREVDRIVVLNAGRVEELGTASELLLRDGYFSGIVSRTQ